MIPRILPFGNCTLTNPLRYLRDHERLKIVWSELANTATPFVSTPNEVQQLLEYLDMKKEIPENIHKYIWPGIISSPTASFNIHERYDAVIFEYRVFTEIVFNGISLSRSRIMNDFTNFFGSIGPSQKELAVEWFNQGLIRFDVERQISVANKLIESIPSEIELPELEHRILLEARAFDRSSQDEVIEQMLRVKSLVKKPLGICSFVWKYLPDGRALTWPIDLRDKLAVAAKNLQIPFFDPPVRLVEKYGLQIVNLESVDYLPHALPKVGDEFTFFIKEILDSAKD